jgi:hypothetical protein
MKRLIVILLVLWTASGAWAGDITYNWTAVAGNWDNPGNWNPNAVPTITAYGDFVTANTSGTVTDRGLNMTGIGPAANVLNNAGTINLVSQNGSTPTLIVTTTLANAGQINISAGYLEVGNNVGVPPWTDPTVGITASGGGSINLAGGKLVITSPLTLNGQTIQGDGSGMVNCGGVAGTCLTVLSGNVVQANGGGLALSGVNVSNGGILQAVNGGTLQLGGGHWSYGPTYINGGTIQALDGSTVLLGYTNSGDYGAAGSITGSTLNTVGSGVIQASTGMVLDGVTNNGNIQVVNEPNVTAGSNFIVLANTINNTGTITLASGNILLTETSTPGNTTLTGGGTVNLGGYGISGQTGNGANGTLTNVNNLIQGAGAFGYITLNNQSAGVIDANTSGQTLSFTGSTINNSGILEASNGGTLQIGGGHWSGGPTYVNGGTIQALNGSTVLLGYTNPGDYDSSGAITGSTLKTAGSGVIQASTGVVLDGITNQGNLQVVNSAGSGTAYAVLADTIDNTGTITMVSGSIQIPGSASLTGGGTVNMGGYSISGGTLTNVDNVIQGAGGIGGITLNNQIAGVIDANTSGQTLSFTGSTINNSGILEASNGGTLQIGGGHWSGGPTNVTGGTIQALNGSTVLLGYTNGGDYGSPGTITGSTFNTTGSGVIQATENVVLNGITNHGTLDVVNIPSVSGGQNLAVLEGTINNTGTINLVSGYIQLSGAVSLTGNGTVNLGGYYITGAPLTSTNTIQGSGSVDTLTNLGTVHTAAGQSMSIGNLTNLSGGTLTGGTYNIAGTLNIQGAIVNNAATIILDGAAASIKYGGTDALAATFADNQAGGTFEILDGRNFTTEGNFSNEGAIDVGAGSELTIDGTFTNTGDLDIDGTLAAAAIIVDAGENLSGSGTIVGNVTVYGDTDPGDDPATLTIDGNYAQTGGSTLNIALGGTGAGQYDQLVVNGNLSLAGALDVSLWGGFVAATGETFDILNWTGTLTGSFNTITYPTLGAGYYFEPLWGSDSLTLEIGYNGGGGGGGGATPEPATYFLIGAGLLVGGYHWRRRRQIGSKN